MKKSNKIKVGLFALTALSSALMAMDASAAICTNGATNTATITFNQSTLATIKGGGRPGGLVLPSADTNTATTSSRYIYLNKFYPDTAFNYATGITNIYPTNYTTQTPDSGTKTLPVVCTTGTPGYQVGNVVSTYNGTSGKIGLAGLIKERSGFQNPTLSLRWGKLNLRYNFTAGSGWELWEDLQGYSLFKLTEVYESKSPAGCVAGTGACTLTLKANVRFAKGTAVSDWGKCIMGTSPSTICNDNSAATIGSGASWWTLSTPEHNNLMMLAGSGTYTTATTTKSGAPLLYGSPRPTGTEAQALIGTIEVTTKY